MKNENQWKKLIYPVSGDSAICLVYFPDCFDHSIGAADKFHGQ
jgi:hypothetical protein